MERMRAYYTNKDLQVSGAHSGMYDSSKLGAPYLVNMIKSIEDPTQERYVLITLTEDFHLEVVNGSVKGQNKYGILQSEIAIAV